MKPLSNGNFGSNIIQVVCPLYRGLSSLRGSNCIKLIGGYIFWGFSFVHCGDVFNTVSLLKGSTVNTRKLLDGDKVIS